MRRPHQGTMVFRADASPAIGSGHIMRCLTLADVLHEDGWHCIFAVRAQTTESVPHLADSGHERVELTGSPDGEAAEMAASLGPCDWLVVDHYGRDAKFETACRSFSGRILVIDDLADRPHDCDLLLDQTLGRTIAAYDKLVPGHAQVLAGSAYALLRPDFAALRPGAAERRAKAAGIGRILISFGGGDAADLIKTVLKAIDLSGVEAEIDVVLGTADPVSIGLGECSERLRARIRLHSFVKDMAAMMLDADLAIGAAGTTSWERCCLGLPALTVILADNQRAVAAALQGEGAARLLGEHDRLDADGLAAILTGLAADQSRLSKMASAAFAVCDGLGAHRVAMAIAPECTKVGEVVTLRPVDDGDRQILFDWQQHPETRRYANTPRPPSWEEHIAWFAAKRSDPLASLNIITAGGQAAGMLRLDQSDRDGQVGFVVSIALSPAHKKRGIGLAALRSAVRLALGQPLFAEIDPANQASLRLFSKAGFKRQTERWFVADNGREGLRP